MGDSVELPAVEETPEPQVEQVEQVEQEPVKEQDGSKE